MTTKEAIYLLRNTAWLAPSLEPIDEAIDMACEALAKDINVRSKDEPLTKCDLCKREGDDICVDCERKKQSGKE